MEAATLAINKMFAKGDTTTTDESPSAVTNDSSTKDTTTGETVTGDAQVEAEIAPAVEHTHVHHQQETRTKAVIDKEYDQDHYHTTIQPLKDTEVAPEQHEYKQEHKHREINKDDGAAAVQAASDREGFQSTSNESFEEKKTTEPTEVNEHVHHHVHEVIQPVIEKDVVKPSVTHKQVNVEEKIQEPAINEGVTVEKPMSVDEFQGSLNGEKKKTVTVEGAAAV